MKVHRSLSSNLASHFSGGSVVTFGNFDGVHLGHRALIHQTVAKATELNLKSVVVTFHPHPAVATGRVSEIPKITSFRQKHQLVAAEGVTDLVELFFSKSFQRFSPQEFIEGVLMHSLGARHVVVGPDARFGFKGEGDKALLSSTFSKIGGTVLEVGFIEQLEDRISSRRIRDLIRAGDLICAAKLLGRNFSISGRVIQGEARGKKLGFPTMNLSISNYVAPSCGVYASYAHVDDTRWPSISNLGIGPTFGGLHQARLETFVLDMPNRDLYGKRVEIEFLARIRDEIKFSSADELKIQIQEDIHQARLLHGQ